MINTNSKIQYVLSGKKVFVAGHCGMVGSALVRRLKFENCREILTITKSELDLRDQHKTLNWITYHNPNVIFLSAAKVGGIYANNTYPADFMYDNLVIASNIIHAAKIAKVEKLLFLGSSCIYPKYSKQPIKETSLLKGPLEPTNQWYALAKIAGIKLCQAYYKQYGLNFISAIPTSLYGIGDNFDINNCHVIPALIQKIHRAKLLNSKEIEVWGTGKPKREFLYIDDCADALILIIKYYSGISPINIGYGQEVSIATLVNTIANCLNFDGSIKFDTSKPDGTPRKLLSSKWLNQMSWKPKITIKEGISKTYEHFISNNAQS
jgi:GDP-L-fucose synthase